MIVSICLLVFFGCGLNFAQPGDESYVSKTEFDALKEKLENLETKLRDTEIRQINSDSQIAELKNQASEKAIFSAALGGTGIIGPYSTDTPLIYKAVKTNIGNAYSSSTGIFTAPVAGVYYFTFYHHAGGEHRAILNLYKNNQFIVRVADHPSNDHADNGGNAAFLQLQQGDQVYVLLAYNSHVWGTGNVTTFSGFLVSQI
ncbi:complement C1q-like protein 4 isoform X19 [Scomber scombrus]|uniref:complement C1q-like protein 4 isoform X19 n=1 Tax=Scomber scombrus TaxID=13677 RepID=UPI002DD9D65B|nr:complement C1q-like protein 4 isoform X19 [Scomber scombrus]